MELLLLLLGRPHLLLWRLLRGRRLRVCRLHVGEVPRGVAAAVEPAGRRVRDVCMLHRRLLQLLLL